MSFIFFVRENILKPRHALSVQISQDCISEQPPAHLALHPAKKTTQIDRLKPCDFAAISLPLLLFDEVQEAPCALLEAKRLIESGSQIKRTSEPKT